MKAKSIPFVILLGSLPATAQTASQTDVVELTAEIAAIDHDARVVTLVDDTGNVESIYAGPDIERFSELKVGDSVTFRYTESRPDLVALTK